MGGPQQTVAVVDDDKSMCQAIARLLSAGGFKAHSFPTGESFLQWQAGHCADCLVLDLHLPGLSGFEVRQQLLELAPQMPVIFITAHDATETRDRAQGSRCAAYLRKPFRGEALLEAVAAAIQQGQGGANPRETA